MSQTKQYYEIMRLIECVFVDLHERNAFLDTPRSELDARTPQQCIDERDTASLYQILESY